MGPCPRRAAPERGCRDSQGHGVAGFATRMIRPQQKKEMDQEAKSKFATYAQLEPPPESATSVEQEEVTCPLVPNSSSRNAGLDQILILKQEVRMLLLVPFGAPNGRAGGSPGPHPSLHLMCQLYYLQHLELPLKLLFEERIPLDQMISKFPSSGKFRGSMVLLALLRRQQAGSLKGTQAASLLPSPAAQAGNRAFRGTDRELVDGHRGAFAHHQEGLEIVVITGRGCKDLIHSSVYLMCLETAVYLPV